jgi:hypothetical protein
MPNLPDSRSGTPDDPWGKNPFPEGTRAHQSWKDTSIWAKEHLTVFHSEMLESLPPEEASPKEFLDHHLKAIAGAFDILAGAFSRSAVLTDDAAGAFEHLLTELENVMVAQASKLRLSCIPEQLRLSEVRGRLLQRKQCWTGQMLRRVREHKEASRANAGADRVDGADPNAAGDGDTTPKRQEAAPAPPATVANGADRGGASWQSIEISFLSDFRVQITLPNRTYSQNYSEMGFADRRAKRGEPKPNGAWLTLRAMAEENGIIRDGAKTGEAWPKVEKRIQEIRKALRKHFGVTTDPIPFVEGTGYQACFKIACGPSFHT